MLWSVHMTNITTCLWSVLVHYTHVTCVPCVAPGDHPVCGPPRLPGQHEGAVGTAAAPGHLLRVSHQGYARVHWRPARETQVCERHRLPAEQVVSDEGVLCKFL